MYFLHLDGVIALLIYELSFKEVNEIVLLTHKIVMSLGVCCIPHDIKQPVLLTHS